MLELDEGKGKPGLWANIHAKRKRGERPARPGEEGYPKTLNIEEIDEAIKADDYVATSEKSQFGGHRPHVVNKSTGKTMHLSAHAYKSPEHAKAHAKEYVSAYSKIGPNAADRAGQAYAKANKDKLADKSVNEAVDPSEIAGNPKAYSVDTVKKAYYHKKASTTDKESLGRHLDRYHGHKEWRKPLVKEDTMVLDELSNDTLKSYAKKAGAEATGVKGKHLSPEKSNKRFDGHAKAMQRLTKESADQLDELSKETLGSYKHKAELSIPKDDREYANRSKGIDKAEKKLKKEEFEQIDEMTQGKSYTQDQLRKKMQSGNWEATHDIKPGKHVEMRHHTGKRVMVHVKEETSLGEATIKVGDTVVYNKNKTAQTVGKVHKIEDNHYILHHTRTNTYHRVPKKDSELAESVEQLDELSPNLLHRYVKKAAGNMGLHAVDHGKYGDEQKDKKSLNKAIKRLSGITSASGRMADKANRTESEINDLAAQYINENNITLEQLENMTEEELNELIGAAVGGAFKLGAKAAVGATRLAGRAINRMTTSGRADAAEKKASALEKKNADRERIRAAQDRLRKAKEAASKR